VIGVRVAAGMREERVALHGPASPASRSPTRARACGAASTSTTAAPSRRRSSATPPRCATRRSPRSSASPRCSRARSTCCRATPPGRITRDTGLGLNFAGINYYDGQGFMVPKKLGRVEREAAERRHRLRAAGHHHRAQPRRLLPRQQDELQAGGDREAGGGRARPTSPAAATSTPPTSRAWCRVRASPSAQNVADRHVILPEVISKEPLGPAVRHGDDRWFDVVKWSLFAMIEAEELGPVARRTSTRT
jgi:hypothetical protein